MEPVGLAIGIAGLAGLFSSCLEAVERFESWKDYGPEWKSVSTRFEAEKILLERWGQAVGLQSVHLHQHHHEALDNSRIRSNVTQLLYLIEDLCGSLGDFKATPPSRTNSSNLATFKVPIPADHGAPDSKWQRLKWALGRGEKSAAQVDQFGLLVQKLYALVPPMDNLQSESILRSSTLSCALDIQEKLEDQNDWLAELRQELEQIKQERESERRAELQKWLLGNTSAADIFDVSVSKRLDGTADWIFAKPPFIDWASLDFPDDHPKTLWINGSPGFGKTILCSRIVQHLQLTASRAPVAHCFCSSDILAQGDSLTPIRSWLTQLIGNYIAFDLIMSAWMRAPDKQKATPSVIAELLSQITRAAAGYTFVLDGLDELSSSGENSQSDYLVDDPVVRLLDTIKRAVAETNTRILLVSRDESNIRDGLRIDGYWKPVEYRISIDDVRHDVASFSRSIVDKKLYNKSEAVKADISQQMTDRCNGQFLWLRLQENSISRGKNKKQLEKVINETPAGLDRLYDRNWNKILDYPKSERIRAFSLLRWAAFSFKPLTVNEITEALLISASAELDLEDMPDEVDEDYVDSEILRLCGSLIEIRSSSAQAHVGDKTVHITHFTIKEYFMQRMAQQGGIFTSNPQVHNGILAELCLQYINSACVWESNPEAGPHWGSFRDYAANSWHRHYVVSEQHGSDLLGRINNFFASDTTSWHGWGNWVDSLITTLRKNLNNATEEEDKTKQKNLDMMNRSIRASFSPLCYAALLGLSDTLVYLLSLGRFDINEQGHSGDTPLATSCRHGNLRMVTTLLNEGADVSITNHYGYPPLSQAAEMDHADVVKLILQQNANIDGPTKTGWTPLHVAALKGAITSLKLLLDAGAAVDSRTESDWTALQAAALGGHFPVVEILLEHKVSINAKDASGWAAIHHAADKGHLDIVQLLCKHGADMGILDNHGWTPLHWAAYSGHAATTEFFMDSGADMTVRDDGGWSPLHHASDKGHLDIVQLLLKRGADVQDLDHDEWTALHWAAYRGNTSIVECLIEAGSDISAKDHRGWTALNWAAFNGQMSTVKVLIERGAHVTSPNNNGWTSLHHAALNGHLSTVEALIEFGADIAAIDSGGWTALHHASDRGHLGIVQVLLQDGADITALDNKGWSALHWASSHGHAETVQLLLQQGADLSVQAEDGATPLISAAGNGHSEVVKVLIDAGAPVETAAKNGQTALLAGTAKGSAEVIRNLLATNCNVEARDAHGRTALFFAAWQGHTTVVKLLLAQSADVNATDRYGATALFPAVKLGREQVVETLLDNSSICITSIDALGKTIAYWAAKCGNAQIFDFVMSYSREKDLNIPEEAFDTEFKQDTGKRFRCDICTRPIHQSTWYWCGACVGGPFGDFDICQQCRETGFRCLSGSHELLEVGLQDGKRTIMTNRTTADEQDND